MSQKLNAMTARIKNLNRNSSVSLKILMIKMISMYQPNVIPVCPQCGGSMRQNTNKRGENQPDFICNQDTGRCGLNGRTGKFMPTGEWADKQGPGNADYKPARGRAMQPVNQPTPPAQMQNDAQEKQAKEESIRWSNAKNNATLLVCHVNILRTLSDQRAIQVKILELANWFYKQDPNPF
jgi:hypothetical protein